jgi:hypothetical protein
MGTFENAASGMSEIEEVRDAVTRQLYHTRMAKPAVLFVGPMLGVHQGWVTSQAEVLADLLSQEGYHCSLASSVINRYGRLLHICWEMISKRNEYDIVCLQVYSGPSFIIEDIASRLASWLGKRLVMVLHGGNMPRFMERFPNWSRRVFMRGSKFVVPSPYLAETLRHYRLEPVIIPNLIPIEEYPFRFRRCVSPRLLWMRTFHEVYNPSMAVRVLAEVKKKYPEAFLIWMRRKRSSLGTTFSLTRTVLIICL